MQEFVFNSRITTSYILVRGFGVLVFHRNDGLQYRLLRCKFAHAMMWSTSEKEPPAEKFAGGKTKKGLVLNCESRHYISIIASYIDKDIYNINAIWIGFLCNFIQCRITVII